MANKLELQGVKLTKFKSIVISGGNIYEKDGKVLFEGELTEDEVLSAVKSLSEKGILEIENKASEPSKKKKE